MDHMVLEILLPMLVLLLEFSTHGVFTGTGIGSRAVAPEQVKQLEKQVTSAASNEGVPLFNAKTSHLNTLWFYWQDYIFEHVCEKSCTRYAIWYNYTASLMITAK